VNQQGRMALVREARLAGSLRHPNIVEIYDIDQHKGWLYLVMEYLHGVPLSRVIGGNNILLMAQKITRAGI
jgi:serine/threonine protein kinase